LNSFIQKGNKCDKEVGGGREVSRKEGEALAQKLGTIFIETSAKTTTGVKDAFVEVVRKIVETPQLWRRNSNAAQNPNSIHVSGSSNQESNSLCSC
jgi:Ras-related protein Rab-18